MMLDPLRHDGRAHVLSGELRPLPQYIREGLVDTGALLFLTAEQRNAFTIFAHPRQRVAIFRFRLVLALGDRDEVASDDHHRAGRERGVDDGGNHEKAGDGDRAAAERQRQCSADGPQHDDERRRRQKCRHHTGKEIDRRVACDTQVLGDPIFRVLVVAADQIELVITAARKPARHHRARQPRAPAPLNAHPRPDLDHTERDRAERQREKDNRKRVDCYRVLFLDRVEDRAIPDVDCVLKTDRCDDQHEQSGAHRP